MQPNPVFIMRNGGFSGLRPGPVSNHLHYLTVPPPEPDPSMVSAWVSFAPWSVTGFSFAYDAPVISESDLMQTEVSFTDSPDDIRKQSGLGVMAQDPEAKEAFQAIAHLLRPTKDNYRDSPQVSDLVSGFSASVAEVIRRYAPHHEAAIASGGGRFIAGDKLGPGLSAFVRVLARTHELNGEDEITPEQPTAGANFASPVFSLGANALFDRAAFRHLFMAETVPQALTVSLFEIRHALDERLSGTPLPVQESWDAMMTDADAWFLSPDRASVPAIGAERRAKREDKSNAQNRHSEMNTNPDSPEDDPASFGL